MDHGRALFISVLIFVLMCLLPYPVVIDSHADNGLVWCKHLPKDSFMVDFVICLNLVTLKLKRELPTGLSPAILDTTTVL
jgi:hypothetical protein